MLSQYMEEKTFKRHAGVHAYQEGEKSIESMQVNGLSAHCFAFRDCVFTVFFLSVSIVYARSW